MITLRGPAQKRIEETADKLREFWPHILILFSLSALRIAPSMINATLAGFLPPFPFPWVYGLHKAFQIRSKSNRSWNSQFQPVSANERWLIKALKAVRGEQVQNTSRADVNARHEENRLGQHCLDLANIANRLGHSRICLRSRSRLRLPRRCHGPLCYGYHLQQLEVRQSSCKAIKSEYRFSRV